MTSQDEDERNLQTIEAICKKKYSNDLSPLSPYVIEDLETGIIDNQLEVREKRAAFLLKALTLVPPLFSIISFLSRQLAPNVQVFDKKKPIISKPEFESIEDQLYDSIPKKPDSSFAFDYSKLTSKIMKNEMAFNSAIDVVHEIVTILRALFTAPDSREAKLWLSDKYLEKSAHKLSDATKLYVSDDVEDIRVFPFIDGTSKSPFQYSLIIR